MAPDQFWPMRRAEYMIFVAGAVPSTQTRWSVPFTSTPMLGRVDDTVGVPETFVGGIQVWVLGAAWTRAPSPPRTRHNPANSRHQRDRVRMRHSLPTGQPDRRPTC